MQEGVSGIIANTLCLDVTDQVTILLLMALSLVSTLLAEGSDHAIYAVIVIFVIAATKGDLVIMHYMEAGRVEPHWRLMYRAWLGIVTVLLISGHIWTD